MGYYFVFMGLLIGILTLTKPKFFWNHPKATFVRKFFGDRGTTIFYLIISITMLTFGIYSLIKVNSGKELEEISILYNDGKIEDAQKKLFKFTFEHPHEYSAWVTLGCTYLDQEKYEKAIESLSKAISINNLSYVPYSGLGLAYKKLGQFAKAKKSFEKADLLNPNNANIIGNLAGICYDLGDIKKSIKFGEKSFLIDSSEVAIVANLSIYYNKAGQIEKRDKLFNKAKELGYKDLQSLIDTYEIDKK